MDTVTLIIFLSFWPVWMIWELILLWFRSDGQPVKTISMVAQGMGYRSSALVYLWSGLATHFWWPGPSWASVPGAVAFWVIALLLILEDLFLLIAKIRQPDDLIWWAKVQRAPPLLMAIGALAGHFLFPQRG
jgi:hypothetical protein